ncbi:hypothetical protein ACOMHN_060864 [Nucella lapillus]
MLTAKLIDSVAAEDLTAAAEYLEGGGSPNSLSVDGATAMHIAAGVGEEAVRLMLAYGGDPNIRSVDGSTPLHVAAAWGDRSTLRLLLHNGANPNIRDHEGQRAVDVARSEEHAACVDFLKYYSMLVAVGDEDESPMYTSELIDPQQSGIPAGLTEEGPPLGAHSHHHAAHYSSDEEEPANLSGQYCDALSRRLSRLLTDGSTACLDATSPDCPFIGEKRDKGRGSGDRTLKAEDISAHLHYLSDSSDDDLALGKRGTNCRCHSNHCCLHNQPSQPDFGVSRETPMRFFDSPGSPEYCDPQMTYAKSVEKKMKEKYFPDMGGDVSLSHGEGSRQDRLAGNVAQRYSPSYLKSLSPQRVKCVHENSAGHVSPCTVSAACCQERRSRSGSKAKHDETCRQQRVGCSPVSDILKASSCSCSNRAHKQQSSPSRGGGEQCVRCEESLSLPFTKHPNVSFTDHEHQRHVTEKQPHSPSSGGTHRTHQLLHSPTRRGLQSELGSAQHCSEISHQCSLHGHTACCSNAHRSPCCPGKQRHTSPSQHILHRSLSDHSKQDYCQEGGRDCGVNKSLRKQPTYPPAERSHFPACAARSPVIMHVQNDESSPPSGVFRHALHYPFTQFGPKDQRGFTSTSGDCKQEVMVAGLRSCHSVDSGFCEKRSTQQHLGTDDVLGYQPKSSMYRTPKHASPAKLHREQTVADTRNMLDKDRKMKDVERSHQFDSYRYMKRCGEHLHQSASEKLDSVAAFEDNCNIVSSNLRGSSHKPDGPRQSKHGHAVCEKDDQMRARKEARRQEPNPANVSDSSSDSFQTCEEASVQSGTHDMKSEYKVYGHKLHSDHISDSEKRGNVYSQSANKAKTVVRDVKNQEKRTCTPHERIEEKPNVESLGFSVSQKDEIRHNHDSCRRTDALTDNFSSAAQESKRRNCRNDGAADQRNTVLSQNDSQPRDQQSKAWHPPSAPLPDDSIMTCDESFLTRSHNYVMSNPPYSVQSNNVSRWLQNVPATTYCSKLKDVKRGGDRTKKRTSDESLVSIASSVQEYIYRDTENGIALIERHISSEFSGSSGRPSLDNGVSVDTDVTVSYDWSDFSIHTNDASSTSSSFDITAGHTLKSQDTFKADETNSCDEDCCSGSDDHEEKSSDKNRKKDEDVKNTKTNREKSQQTPETDTEEINKTNSASQQTIITSQADPVSSDEVRISPELASLSNEAIYHSLKDLGEDPGPVLPSTRQTYLQLLSSLQSGKRHLGLTSSRPGYSSELNRMLSGCLDVEDLAKAELSMVAQFQTPGGCTWREGTVKSCFNYLLLDPRITRNLPLRAKSLSDTEGFKTFLSAVFYIGKGKRSRPYCHLYEAISHQKSPKPKVSQKVEKILSIWSADLGVVSLHCYQNVIPVEAYTREACMVDAVGLVQLTNMKKGDYYGVASTWLTTKRRCMGAYLLRKAFQIFLSEGERQICPLDIQKGK